MQWPIKKALPNSSNMTCNVGRGAKGHHMENVERVPQHDGSFQR